MSSLFLKSVDAVRDASWSGEPKRPETSALTKEFVAAMPRHLNIPFELLSAVFFVNRFALRFRHPRITKLAATSACFDSWKKSRLGPFRDFALVVEKIGALALHSQGITANARN